LSQRRRFISKTQITIAKGCFYNQHSILFFFEPPVLEDAAKGSNKFDGETGKKLKTHRSACSNELKYEDFGREQGNSNQEIQRADGRKFLRRIIAQAA
jgi:hypothetical protein